MLCVVEELLYRPFPIISYTLRAISYIRACSFLQIAAS